MHDPFFLSPPPFLQETIKPLATYLGLTTLPFHIHELLFATTIYTFIYTVISPRVSTALFPNIYPHFPPRTKLNWDVHVVSLVQSSFINFAALWVMWHDNERWNMSWEERVWGYSGAGGMIQAFAAGYFLWDLGICARNRSVFGLGLLAHAVAALVVFSFGFRPFVNFYGPTFILYEISSPFLNFHWFFDKLRMTGSRPQWLNGMMLLFSFFCCRLVWGTYQSIRVYQDVWAALHYTPALRSQATAALQSREFEPLGESDETMRYAGKMHVPVWLAFIYLSSNVILNSLNFYWFGKMIETIKKRFTESKDVKMKRWEGKLRADDGDQDADSAAEVLVEGLVDASTVGESVMVVEQNGTVVAGSDGEIKYEEVDGQGKIHVSGSEIEVDKEKVRKR